jgi:hypothetical protein
MKHDPPDSNQRQPEKTAHEKFLDFGKQVLAVPKSKIDVQEKAWEKRRPSKRKRR